MVDFNVLVEASKAVMAPPQRCEDEEGTQSI